KVFAKVLPKIFCSLPSLDIFCYQEYLLVEFTVEQGTGHFNGPRICQQHQSPGFLLKHIQSKYGSVHLDEKVAFACFEHKTPVDVTAIHSLILMYEYSGRKKISEPLLQVFK